MSSEYERGFAEGVEASARVCDALGAIQRARIDELLPTSPLASAHATAENACTSLAERIRRLTPPASPEPDPVECPSCGGEAGEAHLCGSTHYREKPWRKPPAPEPEAKAVEAWRLALVMEALSCRGPRMVDDATIANIIIEKHGPPPAVVDRELLRAFGERVLGDRTLCEAHFRQGPGTPDAAKERARAERDRLLGLVIDAALAETRVR